MLPCTISCLLSLPRLTTAEEQRIVVSFKTMYGVDGPFRGPANAIRGIAGDDLAWVVAHFVNGKLATTGDLHILVRGLVFKEGR